MRTKLLRKLRWKARQQVFFQKEGGQYSVIYYNIYGLRVFAHPPKPYKSHSMVEAYREQFTKKWHGLALAYLSTHKKQRKRKIKKLDIEKEFNIKL